MKNFWRGFFAECCLGEVQTAMKNILYVSLIVAVGTFTLVGCSQKLSDIQTEYLRMMEEPATPENISATGDYLEKNLKRFDINHADQMVIAFEDYIYSYDSEHMDYSMFLDRFGKYVSQPLCGLYEIKIEEQENPAIVGAKLQKSWRELCERAHFLEVFIKDNKNYQLIQEETAGIYDHYLKAILMGTTENPVFNYDNGSFNDEAQNAYIDFTAAYPDTTVADIMNEYFAYLSSIHFILDYKDAAEITVFSDTCVYLVSEARKRACNK